MISSINKRESPATRSCDGAFFNVENLVHYGTKLCKEGMPQGNEFFKKIDNPLLELKSSGLSILATHFL